MLLNKLALLLIIIQQCSKTYPFIKSFEMALFAFLKATGPGTGDYMRLQ